MKRVLLTPELHGVIKAKVEARLAHFKIEAGKEEQQLTKELVRLDAEVSHLVDFIRVTDATASPGALEAVRQSLEEATARQREVRARLEAAARNARVEPRTPTPAMISSLDVEARFKDDPTGAREALRQLVAEGAIHMDPQPDGSYRARSFLLPEKLAKKSRKPRGGEPSGASGVSHEVVGNGSCAGSQLDFPDQRIQGVAEVWVPFEESIAIGW